METDQFQLKRREVLRVAVRAVGAAAFCGTTLPVSGCATSQRPFGLVGDEPTVPIPPTALGIDVHCHIFNARDLPIPGFVLHVVLEEDPLASAQFGFAVTMISLILDHGARGADDEITALNSGVGHLCAEPPSSVTLAQSDTARFHGIVRAAALTMQNPDPSTRSLSVIQGTHEIITKRAAHQLTLPSNQNPTGAAAGTGGDAPDAKVRRDAYLHRLASLEPGGVVPGLSAKRPVSNPTPDHTATQPVIPPTQPPEPNMLSSEELADAVAAGVTNHASNKSGAFYMASLLTRPRAELALDLAALPRPADQREIALFTPALIDFSFWLAANAESHDDPQPTRAPQDVTSLVDQIRVMSDIAAKNCDHHGIAGGFAVHPFVSFCPWRQIAEQQAGLDPSAQQMALVKDAITTKGFIGVKIYPLMGFRPIGNDIADANYYPARLRLLTDWASQMDSALQRLYHWCADNDVPVMAHCSYSQYSNVNGGLLGGPDGWLNVLAQPGLKNLRLNLAHCGGVWDLSAARIKELQKKSHNQIQTPWSHTVIGALGDSRYPNLYADIADFGEVISVNLPDIHPLPPEPVGGDTSPVVALARLVKNNPASRKRIMYGTDYMFLILSKGTETYVAQMRDCLAQALEIEKADLMGGNAARFLGLNDPKSGTRKRLDKFRGDSFLARWEHELSPSA